MIKRPFTTITLTALIFMVGCADKDQRWPLLGGEPWQWYNVATYEGCRQKPDHGARSTRLLRPCRSTWCCGRARSHRSSKRKDLSVYWRIRVDSEGATLCVGRLVNHPITLVGKHFASSSRFMKSMQGETYGKKQKSLALEDARTWFRGGPNWTTTIEQGGKIKHLKTI